MKHFSELSQTAQRVVDVAEGLVQQLGYNGFSYDDVAKSIGIKKPSIHHHFPTKAELVAVVAQRYTHRFRQSLLDIDGQHVKVVERLTSYADLFEEAFQKDRGLCVCGMLGAEADALPALVMAEVQRFFDLNMDWLTRTIAQGQRDEQLLRNVKAESLSEAYLCALEGAMVVGRGTRASHGPAAVGRTFVKSVLI